jgi:selenocysteine lyase/cysteine desulfurase
MLTAPGSALSPDASVDPIDRDFAALRAREFARLDEHGLAYLDYAASGLPALSQLRAHHAFLTERVLGNPHSDSAPSRASGDVIDRARRLVLDFFDVDASTHDVCFTANASAAIKLVAESYPFGPRAGLVLAADNHNSMNGAREYARRAGARVRVLPLDRELRLRGADECLTGEAARGGGLYAMPAQSNFSGVRHPLELVTRARSLGYQVLLDVAAYAPGHPLSLRACPADFAVLSFYKLFGYPTGVGALVARRDALALLRRPWFAGGTVQYVSVAADCHRLHPDHQAFEDGTPDFLGLAALAPGFALLQEVGLQRLAARISRLTGHLIDRLSALRHAGGTRLVSVYGPTGMSGRGGTVSFNIRDASGRVVPYGAVEARARAAGVALRGGCFCNPGAAEAALAIDATDLAACLEKSGDRFSVERLSRCLGAAVGAVRISLGLASNLADVERAVAVVASFAL